MNSTWQIWRKKISLFFYQAKKLLKYTVSFFAELKKWILFYQAKNLLKYTVSSLQIWRNKYFYHSTKLKRKLLKYAEYSLQIWRNKMYFHFTKQKNLLKYTGSSLQVWRNKYFYHSTKHKKHSLNILGLLWKFEAINIFMILPSKKQLLKYPGSS